MSGIGHNSGANPDILNQTAQGQLKSLVERVESLNVEAAEVRGSIKEVYREAKGNGFDTKILRKLIQVRKQDRAKALEERAILELYASALGILDLV